MDILGTLQALNACHGPSGDEGDIADTLERLAAPYADKCKRDTLGNLIVRRKGKGPKVMFSAHMDSIGMIVTHIDDKGFLRFGRLGGLAPHEILSAPVRFRNGTRGLVALDNKVEAKEMKLDDLYLDIGAGSREEAESLVQVGDTAVFDTPCFASGKRVAGPYLDNRISCAVLLMALEGLAKEADRPDNDCFFVFSVQEELGLRGARTAAYGIDPDYAVAVDVTCPDDELGADHSGSTALGAGAAIKIMDNSVICHPQVVSRLEALARAESIPFQRDVLRSGGTDAGAIHQSRSGVLTGGISVPCRYTHMPMELADLGDVEACVKLVRAFARAELPKP